MSLAAALRTPAFWVFGGATSLFGLVSSGLGLFNEAVLAERGFDQQTYVRFLAGTSIIALVGQLTCGWLTLRWSMQRLLGLAMFIYAAALGALPLLTTLSQLWVFAALIGLSGGMITVMFFAVWRRAFGAAHLGRIQGAAQMLTVLASAIGPLIFAKVRGADRIVLPRRSGRWRRACCCSASPHFACRCLIRIQFPEVITCLAPSMPHCSSFTRRSTSPISIARSRSTARCSASSRPKSGRTTRSSIWQNRHLCCR